MFYSDLLPRAKKLNGLAYVGVTDMAIDKPNNTQKLEFIESDVIFYPDNNSPGELYSMKTTQ